MGKGIGQHHSVDIAKGKNELYFSPWQTTISTNYKFQVFFVDAMMFTWLDLN